MGITSCTKKQGANIIVLKLRDNTSFNNIIELLNTGIKKLSLKMDNGNEFAYSKTQRSLVPIDSSQYEHMTKVIVPKQQQMWNEIECSIKQRYQAMTNGINNGTSKTDQLNAVINDMQDDTNDWLYQFHEYLHCENIMNNLGYTETKVHNWWIHNETEVVRKKIEHSISHNFLD